MNVPEPTAGTTWRLSVPFAAAPSTLKGVTEATESGSSSGTVRDAAAVVTLSGTAKASMSSESASQSAGRSGGKKDFSTVAKDARTAIDAKYAELAAKGRPMDYMHATQEGWDTVFGGFDRRSLFAIASNSDGSFSKDEQDTAQSIMSQQQGQAMTAADPAGSNPAARYRAGASFLDGVSGEEKTSDNWAVQRAAVQFGYEQSVRAGGQDPDALDSGSPLVRMIKGALDGLKDKVPKDKAPGSVATGGYVKDLKDMPLFRNGVPPIADRPLDITA